MGYRYIGSKDKLSEIIIEEIKSIDNSIKHVIDLMAGTGLFSLALRKNNFTVSSADVMTYSYHHLNVHLNLNKAPEFDSVFDIDGIERSDIENNGYLAILNHLNNLTPVKGYFFKEFSPEGDPINTTKLRKYFTAENASKIDAIRLEIKRLRECKLINKLEHSLLIHDLIMAVNDVANIAGTYGHYLSKFVKRAEQPILLHPSRFSDQGSITGHQIFTGYAEDLASDLKGDLCYIDPPYIKRQYAANYHILETIAREDEPDAIGDSGLRPWRDQYSNFCSKVKIRSSFDKIFTDIKCDKFLISYSEDGLIPLDTLLSFLSEYGNVDVKEVKYKRFKSRKDVLKKEKNLNEYLIRLLRS